METKEVAIDLFLGDMKHLKNTYFICISKDPSFFTLVVNLDNIYLSKIQYSKPSSKSSVGYEFVNSSFDTAKLHGKKNNLLQLINSREFYINKQKVYLV